MVDTGIFATTAEVQMKVGNGASTTANTEAFINSFMTQAESYINARTKKNWSDVYAGLNVDVKGILKEAASCLAAMYVMAYDFGNYASRASALMSMNYLYDRAEACIKQLENIEINRFIVGA